MDKKILAFSNLFKPDFKYRRVVQYALLFCLLLFQFALFALFYNEVINENKLEVLKKETDQLNVKIDYLDKAKKSQLLTQDNLQIYLLKGDTIYLDAYYSGMEVMYNYLDSLQNVEWTERSNLHFFDKNNYDLKLNHLKGNIDQLFEVKDESFNFKNFQTFEIKNYKYKDVLKDVDIESFMVVDSIGRKSLFSRLSDALSGKISIQKETLNQVVTMRYGNTVVVGTIEEQFEEAFNRVNSYYRYELSKLNSEIKDIISSQLKLQTKNNVVQNQSNELIQETYQILNDLKQSQQQRFDDQYQFNKSFRRFVYIGLMLMTIILVFILIGFTNLSFQYEKKLNEANAINQKNIIFKSNIINMISHEIRSPLSIISIYAKRINQQLQDDILKSMFGSLQYTTNSLKLLSNQILDFSKNEGKDLRLESTSFELQTELEQILSSLDTLCESYDNRLIKKGRIEKQIWVNSDIVKLQQLLYNIVGNANKFTIAGEITVSYEMERISDFVKLQMKIEDTGVGMSEDVLKKIFEDVQNHQGGLRADEFGFGIGLALCRDIVKLFDGEISLDSKLNKGTAVSFHLYMALKTSNL